MRTPEERAQAIEGEVWSPYCPGRLLIDCTAGQSRVLRDEILRRVEQGQSDHAVLAWIRNEFGDEAIADPSGPGGFVIWLVPVLLFAIGAFVVVRVVRRGRSDAGVSG